MNIVVTGASRGIGFETVKLFSADQQNNVIAIARGREGLGRLSQVCLENKATSNVHTILFDLLEGNYMDTLIPEIVKRMNKIDILVNNAGLLIHKPFEQLEDGDFDKIFGANIKSVFRLTRYLLPYFAKDAHIVNIGSMGGVQGSVKFPGLSLYSASKGALAIFTECLAEELKSRQINVNCLALGSAQTEMLEKAFPGYKAPITGLEMAAFIADFSLHGHRWFNGKILPVSVSTP
jgi:NAD(P)-dependent dehydrogenase (short-subunit alcohol dehydrogenase family)